MKKMCRVALQHTAIERRRRAVGCFSPDGRGRIVGGFPRVRILHAETPEILSPTASSRGMFRFEEFDLRFSNGVERTYQRIAPGARKAVMAVPVNERDEVLLIREYCGGVHEYLLTLPKGAVEPGEDPRDGMNRELKEEIGFGASTSSRCAARSPRSHGF